MSEDEKDKDRKDDVDESTSDTIEEKKVEAPREEEDSPEEDAAEEEVTEDEEEEGRTEERKPLTKPPAPKKKVEEAGPLGIPQRDILPLVIALAGLLLMVFARYQTANLNLLYGGLGLVVIGVIAFVVTNLTR